MACSAPGSNYQKDSSSSWQRYEQCAIVCLLTEEQARIKELEKRDEEREKHNQQLQQQVAILTQQIEHLKRQLFGKSSEKLDHPELFEDEPGKEVSSGGADAPAGDDARNAALKTEEPKRRRPMREERLPDNLLVIEVEEIPAAVLAEPQRWRRTGKVDSHTQLEKEPPYYYLRRMLRPRFVPIDDPLHPPVAAPAKRAMIEGGFWGTGLLAEILCNKYLYHLPFTRQHVREKQRFGIDLSVNTMCDAAEKVAEQCGIVVTRMKELMLESGYVRADETFIRYLDTMAAGGSSTGYYWAYRGRHDVIFDWQTSREHCHAADWLGPAFEGVVQSDAYEAYESYCATQRLSGKRVTRAACMAHIRRKFNEAESERPGVVRWILRIIAQLYRIETRLRDHEASAEVRARVRQNQSAPILVLLDRAIRYLLSRPILPKSGLGKALRYGLAQLPAMQTYLEDGRVEIDNNGVENDIRPSAVGKKNWLFVGSPQAGKRGAVLYTLLISARNHGADPQAYLKDLIERLPGARPSEIDHLLPGNWAAANRDKHPAVLAPRAA